MRLAYISDQRFYQYGGRWYTTASLPVAEIIHELNLGITHWTVFGRLEHLSQAPVAMYPIDAPPDVVLEFRGIVGMGSGLRAYVGSLPNYLSQARAAAATADVVWLKLPFVSSYLVTFAGRHGKQLWLAHLVGDPHTALTATLGRRYSFLAQLAFVATRWAIGRSDLAFFVSRHLLVKYGGRHPRCRVINESRVRLSDIRSEPKVAGSVARLVFVGRLSPEKGVDVLFDAVGRLQEAGVQVHLDVIGDGPLRSQLQDLANARFAPGVVRFRGSLPWGKALFSAIRESDVLVLPSWTEGLSLVLVEAMSQGLPCIGTAVGGTPEIIKDGINGCLVPPGDVQALADRVAWVFQDPVRYVELSRQCLETANEYSFESQMARLSKAINEVLEDREMW